MVKIPNRLEDLYPAGAIERVLDVLQQPDISGKVREALDRVGIRDANPVEHVQSAFRQARNWFETFTRGAPGIGLSASMINATGSLFTPAVSRLPTSTAVAHAYAEALVGFQNEAFIAAQANEVVSSLFGHVHGSWHVSTTSAFSALLASKQVFVSKRDHVRVPGLGDIGAMLAGSAVIEVGATNGCSREDWQQELAISRLEKKRVGSAATGTLDPCVLLISPNGQSGESAETARSDAIQCAQHAGVAVYELVADGVVSRQLADEFDFPNLKQRLSGGVDLVIAPLHLLIGAPVGTVVFGRESDVAPLRRIATMSGTALTGPELLAAAVALRLGEADNAENGPTASLMVNPENLRNRAERLAAQARATKVIREASVRERELSIGPPPWDRYRLTNWVIELGLDGDPRHFRDALLSPSSATVGDVDHSNTAIVAPVAAAYEGNKVLLDLRFVDPKDDHLIAQALAPGSSFAKSGEASE